MKGEKDYKENKVNFHKEEPMAWGKKKYITAYDPTIRRRVVFIVIGGWAISLVTGYRFRYSG